MEESIFGICAGCKEKVVPQNKYAEQLIILGKPVYCTYCRRNGRQWTQATYADYLKSDHWQVVKAAAMRRAGERCQVCASTERLQVHHNCYDRLGGESQYDLVVLCKDCHELFHGVT